MNVADLSDTPMLSVSLFAHLLAPVPTWVRRAHIHTGDHRQMWEHMLRTSCSTIQSFLFSYSFVVFLPYRYTEIKVPENIRFVFLGVESLVSVKLLIQAGIGQQAL